MPTNYARRVQRNTLTYAQMEGKGLWGDFKKFVKKHKIISRTLGAAGLAAKFIPIPGASAASLPLGVAGTAAGLAGYGQYGGAMSGKGITKAQLDAIRSGLSHWMPSGGVSMAAAKYLYPRIKNILPSQVRSLAAGLGRLVKSGGISLRGGKHSGMYHKGCIKRLHPRMKPAVMPRMYGQGYSGRGVKLAGQGRKPVRRRRKPGMHPVGYRPAYPGGPLVKMAGTGRRQGQKKKLIRMRPAMPVYRY